MTIFKPLIIDYALRDVSLLHNKAINKYTKMSILSVAIFSITLPTLATAQNNYENTNSNSNDISGLNFQKVVPKTQIDWDVLATAHSPVQPIADFIDNWSAPLDSGEHAYAQGRIALNVRPANSAISYGLAWRYDYLIEFSEETADLYWQYQNEKNPNKSQSYPLFLEAKHNERVGANLSITKQIYPDWQFTTRANIWQGLHALDGKISGNLSTRALSDDEFTNIRDSLDKTNAFLDYYYDEPALGEENLNWNPKQPSGYGYSIDMQLEGKLTNNTQLSVRGYDILGRMHWQEMPSTRYQLDYDVNGRPLYTIEGQLKTRDVTQTLPWRVETNLLHQLNNQWQFGAHTQTNNIQTLYQLSAGYQPANIKFPVRLTGLIEPQTKALGLAIDNKYGGLKFLADSLDAEKAKRSEISLYGRYPW